MKTLKKDLLVVGCGLSGAFLSSKLEEGSFDYLVIEMDTKCGGLARFLSSIDGEDVGILRSLGVIKREGTLNRILDIIESLNDSQNIITGSTAIKLEGENLYVLSKKEGVIKIKFGSIILATGVRDLTRWELKITGKDVYGFYSTTSAMRILDLGFRLGDATIVYGSTLRAKIALVKLYRLLRKKKMKRLTWVVDKAREYSLEGIDVTEGIITRFLGDKKISGVIINKNKEEFLEECDSVVLGLKQKPRLGFVSNLESIHGRTITCGEASGGVESLEDIIESCENVLKRL